MPDKADAPGFMTRLRELRWPLAQMAGVAAVSLAVAAVGLRLWKADLRVPFEYGGDVLLMALWLKTTVDHGWSLVNPRLGAPGRLELFDFPPQGDHLHLLAIKVMSWLTSDWAVLLNVYYLLGFPLIACTTFAVLRHFRVGAGPALVASVLYAFLPSRLLKGVGHLYLDTFFQVPLGIMVALWVCGATPPLVRPGPGLDRPRRRSTAAAAICALLSVTGVHFAFFSGILIAAGGVWASWRRRTWRNAAAGFALCGIIVLGLVAGTMPTLIHWAKHGSNPHVATRRHQEAEIYGMRVAQLLLPATGHRVPALRRLKERYDASAPFYGETSFTSLGLVASAGFLALLGIVLVGTRGERPREELLRKLAALNLVAVLVGTIGGFGSLFALFVTPQIRSYSRLNVPIAFLSLFALVLIAERVAERRERLVRIALPIVLALGLLDQATPLAVRRYAKIQAAFRGDARFVQSMEAATAPGAMIFQLPHQSFPEGGRQHRAEDYDGLRPYLHSRTLRWSYPSMRGRTGDAWASMVAAREPDRMLALLVDAGFEGILLDRHGYPDAGARLEAALRRVPEIAASEAGDGRQVFFSLSAFAKQAHAGLAPEELSSRRERALHPVLLTWGEGFFGQELWSGEPFRWCSGSCELIVENALSIERPASIAATFAAAQPPATLSIEGPLVSEALPLPEGGLRWERTLRVPPGRHVIRLKSDGRPAIAPADPRRLIWRAHDMRLEEVGSP